MDLKYLQCVRRELPYQHHAARSLLFDNFFRAAHILLNIFQFLQRQINMQKFSKDFLLIVDYGHDSKILISYLPIK